MAGPVVFRRFFWLALAGIVPIALGFAFSLLRSQDSPLVELTQTIEETVPFVPLSERTLAQLEERTVNAQALCRSGRYEEGAAALAERLPRQTPAEVLQRAAYVRAWCHLLNGEPELAAHDAREALALAPPTPTLLLLLAQAELSRGQYEAVLPLAEQLLDQAPLLQGYARLLQAQAHLARGEPEAAQAALAALPPGSVSPAQTRAALRETADLLHQQGQSQSAYALYTQLLQLGPPSWEQADIRFLLGSLAWDLGRIEEAVSHWRAVVQEHYSSSVARDALQGLDVLSPESVSEYFRGLVLYYADANEQAIAAFDRALAQRPSADDQVRIRYFRALAERDAGRPDAALAQLEELVARFPFHDLADDALWQRAQLLQRLASPRAIAEYERLAVAYPASPFGLRARSQIALARYQNGDLAGALQQWEALAAPGVPAQDRSRALFWIAKVALAQGQTERAHAAISQLDAIAPESYYALRAHSLTEQQPFWAPATTFVPLPAASGPALLVSGAEATGDGGPSASQLAGRERGQRALALAEAGLLPAALAEGRALLSEDLSAQELAFWAQTFAQAGLPSLTFSFASSLERRLSASTAQGFDMAAVRRHRYPLAYPELVEREAQRAGLDPLLLLALVRQESAYDPVARSPAQARGLTQVIPSTGKDLADRLGVAGFKNEHLDRPAVSLRFGAYYLSMLLRQFDGDLVLALAAYNGGPGNVARWRAMLPTYDPDLFIETIPFEETRRFVPIILENYGQYRALYAGPERP